MAKHMFLPLSNQFCAAHGLFLIRLVILCPFLTACGGTFTTTSAVMQSPLYPENYPVNMLCQWVIQLPPQYRIRLEFMDFQLEESTSCQYDFVLVMNGSPSSPKALGKYCGNSSKSVVDSTTNVMTVLFKSDETKSKKGFQAYWYAISVTPSPITPTKFPSTNGTGEYNNDNNFIAMFLNIGFAR